MTVCHGEMADVAFLALAFPSVARTGVLSLPTRV